MDAYFLYMTSRLEKLRHDAQEDEKGWFAEMKSWSFWRAVIAEFLATLLFVFIGTMSAVAITPSADANATFIRIGLTFGLMIAVCIQMIGHVSGGHMNPAVSIAMMVARAISPVRALMYTIAQSVGGILGSLLLKGLTPDRLHSNLGVTTVTNQISEGQGLVCEIVFTFILVTSIFGCTDSNRALFGSPALGIGLTVSVLHFAAIPFTGASMNPARSLGSAVVSDVFDTHWVYWVGPIIGGCVSAIVYKYLLSPYRGIKTIDEAETQLASSSDVIVIPKTYFSAGEPSTVTEVQTFNSKF